MCSSARGYAVNIVFDTRAALGLGRCCAGKAEKLRISPRGKNGNRKSGKYANDDRFRRINERNGEHSIRAGKKKKNVPISAGAN